ncbi:MAG: RNA polymerase sigma factor [Mycobacteriales bacterium]
MAELWEAVHSWPSLVLVIAMFGFAPGACLRLIVLAYPRHDPRRRELIAELYAVPRIQRPLWVAEQLEVALFEGLAHRVSATIRRRADLRRARALTRAGDDKQPLAWEELINRYGRLVRSTVASFRLQPADAEDAVQNTWLRLLERIDTIKAPEHLEGWLTTTTRREWLVLLRLRHRE